MARVSLLEAYDNKDVVQQIYRLMEEMDGGTIQDFEASKDSETGIITIKVTMNDDSVKEYSIPSVDGVTLDTAQTVSGAKVFSAASGNQFTGDLDVGGDLSVAGDTVLGDEMEVAGAAFERSGNDLVVSPTARLLVKTGGGANQEMVVGTDSVIVDKLLESTTPTADSDVKTVTNIEYCAKTDGTNNLVHTNGEEEITGPKTFDASVIGKISGNYPTFHLMKNQVCNYNEIPSSEVGMGLIFAGPNGETIGWLRFDIETDGGRALKLFIRDTSGNYHETVLASYSP